VRRAAGLWVAPLCICIGASVAGAAAPSPHKIAVQLHGPVALVEVTRELPADTDRPATAGRPSEHVLDVALPEGAALVDVAVSDRAEWRVTTPAPLERATREYVDRLERRSLAPVREPFDESTSVRIRVTADAGAAPLLRYRFALLPGTSGGRRRIRFPPSPERLPVPADVVLTGAGTKDVDVAGAHASRARVSTRGAWDLSWAPRSAGTARLAGSVAVARTSRAETLAAVSVEARAAKPVEVPPNVLFVIDRSRSVGLPGLAAERDLAGRLLEALPPSTRFEALFFDRQVRRLFRAPRPATREALSALEAEMVPDRLRNGTDALGALREAGALLRREAVGFGPRALLVLVTDGALPDRRDGEALVRALGDTPGVELAIAAFVVRPAGDDPAPPEAARALRHLAAARGGLLRELTANELGDAIPAALGALARGGDVAELRLAGAGADRALATHLAPGDGRASLLRLPDPARAGELVGTAGGARVHLSLRAEAVDVRWLRALAAPPSPSVARLYASDALVALVEQPARAVPPGTDVVRGSLDRTVVRNTLSLAYMPRARACYLNRTAATKNERDLSGRVRLAIDFTRGEVGDVVVQSSTLNHPGVEGCLRDGAFAIDVPRTLRSDSPSTAVLNLVFRPRTPERHETPEEAALGAQIDLVIEELGGGVGTAGTEPANEPPAPDRSMIPTR
jgi:hypothetical protein